MSLSVEEKQKIIAAVPHWTSKPKQLPNLPQISWDNIESFHSGFLCVKQARKYLDFPKKLVPRYNTFKDSQTKIFKVSVCHYWTKDKVHHVYICYDDPVHLWALCNCARQFSFLLVFSPLFPLFFPHNFFRKLGLCVHTAVAMIVEWGRRNPEAYDVKFRKNRDGRNRPTTKRIVDHLQASVFSKAKSRVRAAVFKQKK